MVKEVNGGQNLNGVTYDNAEYHIEVKVEDNNEGGVKSTAIIRKGESIVTSLDFANTYKATNATVSVTGTKTLENRTLAENEFKFFLYPANENYVVDTQATPKEAKNDADGSFAFDALTFEEVGTYYFVITEDAGTTAERVTNDTSVYHVAIEIKDDEDGKLYEASRVIKKVGSDDAVEEITFNNVFTPKPDDITVDIGVKKTVVNKGSEKIGPDGFAFVLEDMATSEKWNVKSDAAGNAKFTLGYTEDDIGKTYTYKLAEVNGGKANVSYSTAEYTITVAIELNANNELVATLSKNGKNVTEVVAEFENVYDYTPVPPNPEYPDSPQTGDTTNLHLWFALLFVSGGGIFGTTLYGRKKKETK